MPVQALMKRRLGRTALEVTTFGFGGTGLGNIYAAVAEDEAAATIHAALAAGVRYVDTAPLYGHGLSELRVGAALRAGTWDGLVLSTKVGWRLRAAPGRSVDAGIFQDTPPFERMVDYSYDGALRSFEDSLQRLGRNRVDILFIHDVDRRNQGGDYPRRFREAMDGAYRAVARLRDDGVVAAIGVGVNEWEPCRDFAEAGDFDCFLLAGRYTLLEQAALDVFLPLCRERGIGVIVGGPYNSGILASGPGPGAMFDYAPAPPAVLERVRRIQAVCARHAVPLAAAALQFPLGHPAVASVIPGARSPAEVATNLRLFAHPIPADLWRELKAEGLMRADAPTP